MLAPPEREVSLPESGQNIPKQQRRFITLEEQVGLGEAAKAAAAAASKQESKHRSVSMGTGS